MIIDCRSEIIQPIFDDINQYMHQHCTNQEGELCIHGHQKFLSCNIPYHRLNFIFITETG